MKRHLLDLSFDAWTDWFRQQGLPAYRARQLRQAVFHRRVGSFDEIAELPKELRARLTEEFDLWTTEVAAHQRSADGSEKLLLKLADGNAIECVLLRQGPQRRTICISTQVGCAMGCVFCASGLDGVARNLTQGEIVEQMLRLNRLLSPPGRPGEERLSHIVVMGMGEPLANLDRLLPALAQAAHPDGLGIGARRITISTVGLPEGIRRLAAENLQYHLAVSLHAPDDALRNELVKVNRTIGLEPILAAAEEYFQATGRRLTFEYVLLDQLNDRPQHARQLAARLRGRTALVNVIPYNPVAGLPYQTPSEQAVQRFCRILEENGVAIKVRQRKGDAIDAACGQLRRNRQQAKVQTIDLAP